MPFDADDRLLVYSILGLPAVPSATAFIQFVPNTELNEEQALRTYDLAAIITIIDAKLDALNANGLSAIGTFLSRWIEIGGTDPTNFDNQFGFDTDTAPFNYPKERANIRTHIMNMLGVWIPLGGFTGAMNKAAATPLVSR